MKRSARTRAPGTKRGGAGGAEEDAEGNLGRRQSMLARCLSELDGGVYVVFAVGQILNLAPVEPLAADCGHDGSGGKDQFAVRNGHRGIVCLDANLTQGVTGRSYIGRFGAEQIPGGVVETNPPDRKSTRLNSS